jgi:hypothetical protein
MAFNPRVHKAIASRNVYDLETVVAVIIFPLEPLTVNVDEGGIMEGQGKLISDNY